MVKVMLNNKNKVSIVDVAKHAGVGVGTVSRAINDNGSISLETKQKIMQSINELGYVPNRIAQSLRSQQYKNILFFVNMSIPTFPKIINGIYSQLENEGYMLSLCNIGANNILDKIKLYTSHHHFDGIILASPHEDDEELNEFLRSLNVPVVTFELVIPGLATGISVDYHTAVKHATNYLFSLNHKNIALLCSSTDIPSNRAIIEGFKDSFATNNLDLDENLIVRINSSSNDFNTSELINLMPKIRSKKVSAILCMHRTFLPGLLQVMKDSQISYPEDVSLVAIEDYELTSLLNPSITVIKRPLLQMGKKIAEMVLHFIQKPELYGNSVPTVISTEFIVRESCKVLNEKE